MYLVAALLIRFVFVLFDDVGEVEVEGDVEVDGDEVEVW